uniref:Uncharacterized protein n=2 Tax=Enterobacterales TaxID=91347 RepID=A0A7G9A808_RAOOR|nr:Hypothetical protein [Raoultella ornithinolytica]
MAKCYRRSERFTLAINIPEGCPPDFRVSIHSLAGSTLLFMQIKVVVHATAVTFLDKVSKV